MGTSSPAPWKQLLLCSIQSNSHLKHYSYFQLVTVSSNSRPSNRTVVFTFRGFEDDSDKILINTDTRSRKVDYLNLKSNVRLVFTSKPGRLDGVKLWTSDNINP